MLQIRDTMTRDVITVTPQTTLREAADLFARHHISGAPVLGGHTVVGVVSATDLLEFVASNESPPSSGDDGTGGEQDERTAGDFDDEATGLFFADQPPERSSIEDEPFAMDNTGPRDLFSDHTVDEVMSRDICSLPPHALITEAAQYMWKAGVHRLLVLENGHLAGILSASDVVRAVAKQDVDPDEYVPRDAGHRSWKSPA